MPGSVLWLVIVIGAMAGAWYAGLGVSRVQDRWRRGCLIGGAVLLLLGWTALIRHPSVALNIIPVSVLARLEGVGAAPLFLFILSVGWRLSTFRRQRAVMVVGMCLCAAYLLQGGMWMVRVTPKDAFGRNQNILVVHQSRDYSCVPAASATTLKMLGQRTDEAEMAELTETRAGSGATLLRALHGIQTRLKHTGIQPRLLEPDYDELGHIQPPMLTPLQYEATRLHMVTIVEVRPHMVVVADPQTGVEFLLRQTFLDLYRGQVIAFEGGARRATTQDVLREFPHLSDPDQVRVLSKLSR